MLTGFSYPVFEVTGQSLDRLSVLTHYSELLYRVTVQTCYMDLWY